MDSLQVNLHTEGGPEGISTRYLSVQRFIAVVGSEEQVQQYEVSITYEEVFNDAATLGEKPTLTLVDIDVDNLPDEDVESVVRGQIEKWARHNGIHIPSKIVKGV